MRRVVLAVAGVAALAISQAMAEDWQGLDREYGTAAGCAADYRNLTDDVLVLRPDAIVWRGHICEFQLWDGTFEYATWIANCYETQPNLRRHFVTQQMPGEPDALKVFGGDGTDSSGWIELGIVRPCD